MTNSRLLNFNYGQYNKVQWKKHRDFLKILSTITGCLLFSFIYLFIYSFLALKDFFQQLQIKTFNNLSLLKFFWHAEAAPRRCSPRGRCSADLLQIFGSVSMRRGDINNVAERICWIRTTALLFSSEFASCLQSTFSESISEGLLLNKDHVIYD